MSHYFSLPLALTLISASTPLAPSVALKSGAYSCTLKNSDGPIKSTKPAELNIFREEESISAVFVKASGQRIIATKGISDNDFYAIKGDVTDLEKYSMDFTYGVDVDPTYKTIAWSVMKSKTDSSGGVRRSESKFDCQATEKPVLLVSKPTYFECQVGELVDGKAKLSFALYHMAEPTLVSVAGTDSEDAPIRVTPEESVLMSLNDNLDVRLDDKGNISIRGDADGMFLIYLDLTKKSGFTKGTATHVDLEHGDGPKQTAPVTCSLQN